MKHLQSGSRSGIEREESLMSKTNIEVFAGMAEAKGRLPRGGSPHFLTLINCSRIPEESPSPGLLFNFKNLGVPVFQGLLEGQMVSFPIYV